MNTEQKAKAYDDAFNRAKSWYTDAQIDFKKSLETLFPELKCDDEKIRKEIIKCVKNYGPSSANPQLFKNMLAWLEKQGTSYTKRDVDNAFVEGMAYAKEELEKQGEHTDKVESKFHEGDIVRHKNIEGSECTIEFIDDLTYYGDTTNFDIKDQNNWELVEQKYAWNEEDEERINRISDFIWKNRKGDTDEIYQQEQDVNWLKSLRPQKQWKPSEEQIKILNEILNFAANHESPYWNDYIFGTLNNLIRQLKKLTE